MSDHWRARVFQRRLQVAQGGRHHFAGGVPDAEGGGDVVYVPRGAGEVQQGAQGLQAHSAQLARHPVFKRLHIVTGFVFQRLHLSRLPESEGGGGGEGANGFALFGV